MGKEVFVQVRMPVRHLAFGSLTSKRGRVADVLVESVVRQPQRPTFRSLAILRGADGAEVKALAEDLQARYVAASRILGSDRIVFEIDHDKLPDAIYGALLAFQATFGPAWMHFAGGRLWLRAQTVDCAPEDCVSRLKHALAMAEIKAKVDVLRLDGKDLESWQGLMDWRAANDGAAVAPDALTQDTGA